MSTTNDTSTNKQDQSKQAVSQIEDELTDEDLSELSGGLKCDGDLSTDQSDYNSTHEMSGNHDW